MAKVIVSATLLYLALRKLNFPSAGARFYDVNISWLLAALGVLVAQLALSSYRWHIISGLCGISISISRMMRFVWIGMFFNQTLPSSVGGDAVRIWLLVRDGSSWPSATYTVLLDRAIGLFALSVIVISSIGWAFAMIPDSTARLTLLFIGFGTSAGFVVFTLLRFMRHCSLMRWAAVNHLVQLSTLAGNTIVSPRTGPVVAILSLFIQFLTVLTIWCLGKAAHTPFDLLHSLVLVPPVMLISTLPISIAGWGVRETAFALAFTYAGLPQSDGILVSLMFGVSLMLLGALGGLAWLATPGYAQKNTIDSASGGNR